MVFQTPVKVACTDLDLVIWNWVKFQNELNSSFLLEKCQKEVDKIRGCLTRSRNTTATYTRPAAPPWSYTTGMQAVILSLLLAALCPTFVLLMAKRHSTWIQANTETTVELYTMKMKYRQVYTSVS